MKDVSLEPLLPRPKKSTRSLDIMLEKDFEKVGLKAPDKKFKSTKLLNTQAKLCLANEEAK